MDKLKMQSENLVDENVEKIALAFPNCVTEGKDENGQVVKLVDFDLLKQELSKVVVDGNDERYTLNWAGKKQAILTANSPINATLRPCREESVDFDNTKNLYIEGDNLDVLKLLRETYLNKIKIIYIDPPYNTGNDFVYNDDFASSADEYLQNSKSYDEDGNRMVQNLESNGRFHSDWLSMMYPRLKLARDLLTDDGVIFISIDDNEQANLKKICDEIFGEQNFVANIIWRRKTGSSDANCIATITEYALVYAKSITFAKNIFSIDKNSYDVDRYKLIDEYVNVRGKHYIDNLDRGSLGYVASLDFGIPTPDGTLAFPNGRTKQFNDGWRWTWGKEKVEWGLKNGFIEFRRSKDKECGWTVCRKNYLKVDNEGKLFEKGSPHKNLILDILNTKATLDLRELLNAKVFDYSKPVEYLKLLISYLKLKNDIVLDFFSGSATTAHAVMQLNAEDGGNRKFIMVQLPEKCDEKSEAYKAGYKNICEIGKERIRRAGKKIVEEIKNASITFGKNRKDVKEMSADERKSFDKAINMASEKLNQEDGLKNLEDFMNQADRTIPDIGFRVLKLDSSNMKDVYYTPAETPQASLLDLVSNIKEDRSPEDLLFQVMLDMGVMLSSDIKTLDIKGKKVFNVNDGNLVCCFDENLTDEVVTEIAKMQPLYAVFRDSSMSSDSVAVNFDQIFETYSPSTTRKVL